MELFEQFIREKSYLVNVSPSTIRSYNQAWNKYRRYADTLDKPSFGSSRIYAFYR
ncbi:MAG: hypothetical protein LC785_11915 [Acidobacteria bacterium]|nr:hypothetical protein [Acidobacteriota bacterium]